MAHPAVWFNCVAPTALGVAVAPALTVDMGARASAWGLSGDFLRECLVGLVSSLRRMLSLVSAGSEPA
eukprot:937762-Alexandrium_andersonii.AAC.1